jgi:hypothetical protein
MELRFSNLKTETARTAAARSTAVWASEIMQR